MQAGSRARRAWPISAGACIWLALSGVPALAQNEGNGSGGASSGSSLDNKQVTLNVDDAKLSDALHTLMGSVQADFTLDNALLDATVTVHLNSVRFPVALETLLKSCSQPIEYKLENGIYRFVPKVEPPPPVEPPAAPSAPKPPPQRYVEKIPLTYASARAICYLLGATAALYEGRPYYLPPTNPRQFQSGSFSSYGSNSQFGVGSGGFFGGSSSSTSYVDPRTGVIVKNRSGGGVSINWNNLLNSLLTRGRRR